MPPSTRSPRTTHSQISSAAYTRSIGARRSTHLSRTGRRSRRRPGRKQRPGWICCRMRRAAVSSPLLLAARARAYGSLTATKLPPLRRRRRRGVLVSCWWWIGGRKLPCRPRSVRCFRFMILVGVVLGLEGSVPLQFAKQQVGGRSRRLRAAGSGPLPSV